MSLATLDLLANLPRLLVFVLALSSLFLAYVVGTAIYNIFLHPLSSYPGPPLWAAFRFPYVLSMLRGDLHRQMHDFHTKYGRVVRLAPNELSYTDPQGWKDIYQTRPGHLPFERNDVWFKKVKPDDPNTVMGSHEEDHTRMRKVFMQAFTDKALRDYAPMVESYVASMVEGFKQRIATEHGTATVDMTDWLNYVTFDVSTDLSFGQSFDCVKHGKADPWVAIFVDFGKAVAMISSINQYSPLDRLLKYVLPKATRQRALDHREMTVQRVHQRLELGQRRPDWMTAFTGYKDEKNTIVTTSELEANMPIIVFAGSETTSTALSGTLRYLLQNPKSLSKVAQEVRSSFSHESELTIATTGKLEYLNAVINEGMRLCPPSSIGVPRVVPAGGDTICGKPVPAGTFVALNQYAAYRATTNFTRPHEFLPERFLPSSDDFQGDELSVFLPFATGRHSCIGMRLAYAEMRLVMARLLFAFDMALLDEHDTWDWGVQKTFIFWEKRPCHVLLRAAG